MTDAQTLAKNFLQKAKSSIPLTPAAPINAFKVLFAVQDLSEEDNRAVDQILIGGSEPSLFPTTSLESDALELKRITKELKAIKRQELLLIGERIAHAREVLKKYGDRSFRAWMELTFGSFKTGYNYLAFFDFSSSLPEDLKPRLKDLPAKAAYVLASKPAPIEKKIEILKNHASETAQDLIFLIQESLGSSHARKRKKRPDIDRAFDWIEKEIHLLLQRNETLDLAQKQRARALIDQLKSLDA